MSRLTPLALSVVLGTLLGCSNNKPPVAELPAPDVTVQPVVVNKNEINFDTFEGRIAAVSTVDVRMRATGFLLEYGFTEGTEVKEGEPLFSIDPRLYEAQLGVAEGQLKSLEARVARLNEDFERVERLRPGGGISREEYDKVKGDRNEAIASRDGAIASVNKAKLDLGFCKYAAPPTRPPGGKWRIDRLFVTPGNLILADNTILTTLTSISPVYVNFDVDERSLLEYQRNARASGGARPKGTPLKDLKIACEVALDSDQGFPHKGVLDFSASKLDPTTGTYPVRGVLDNPDQIFTPGLRARVRVASGQPFTAILIPERAILTDQTRRYVYVVKDVKAAEGKGREGVAHRVDIEQGQARPNGLVIVRNGLSEGDVVIVDNIQRVRPQGKVKFE